MEYQVLSNIQVQQVPTDQFPDRNWLLVFSFMNRYEAESSWDNLTQTFMLVLPKNVRIKAYRITNNNFFTIPDVQTSFVQLGNINGNLSNLGGFDKTPVFLAGDMIKFNVGYSAIVNKAQTTYFTGQNGVPDLFKGYISKVNPKLPFSLQCEDNMWLLKQMPTPNKNWQNWKLQGIVSKVIADSQSLPVIQKYKGYVNLKVSDFSKEEIQFNVQNLTTTYTSLAAFLARLKTEYNVDSYFRGDELRIGLLHYLPQDTVKHTFTFQKNILDNDKLKWQRIDDRMISAIVKSNYLIEDTATTLDGQKKTKHASTTILIYGSVNKYNYVVKEKGKDFPTKYLNQIGERFTFNIFDAITDPKKLFDIGLPMLKKRYYDGFVGSFTTFGIPYVKHGDTVQLINPALPEQNGLYKVKAVRYFGGYDDGLRQEITIDYKVTE